MASLRVLIEGRPGSGKTTAVRRLVDLLRDDGMELAGFTTAELREGRRRVGFEVETLGGERGLLAHVDLPGPPRVGKYGVDLETFERLALPELDNPPAGAAVVIDELGKMELASEPFREAVATLLERPNALVAAVHAFRHPVTDALKRRDDVEVIPLSSRNRDQLPAELAARLSPSP